MKPYALTNNNTDDRIYLGSVKFIRIDMNKEEVKTVRRHNELYSLINKSFGIIAILHVVTITLLMILIFTK